MPENNTVNPRIESLLDIRRFEPNLQINDPQYTRTLNEYLRQLQNNIEDILKVPFLQGRQGDSVTIGEFDVFESIEDPDNQGTQIIVPTDIGKELIKALFPLILQDAQDAWEHSYTDSEHNEHSKAWYAWQDFIDNGSYTDPESQVSTTWQEYKPVNGISAWKNLCPNNEYNLQVQLYYINNYNDPTERIPLGSATYFVYYDPRLVEISGGHDSTFVFEDVSAAVFREILNPGTPSESYRFVNSGILPTIYWSAETGYWCWSINNIHTGIRCEGVRGQDGLDGNARVVRVSTDDIDENEGFQGMEICTINSVFDTALNGWVNYGEEGFNSLLEEDMVVFAIIDDAIPPEETQPVPYNPDLSFGVVFKDATTNTWKCYAYINTSLGRLAQIVSLESLLNQINSSNNTPIKGLFVKDYGSTERIQPSQALYHCLYSNTSNTFKLSPMKIYSNGGNVRFDVGIERDKTLDIDYTTINLNHNVLYLRTENTNDVYGYIKNHYDRNNNYLSILRIHGNNRLYLTSPQIRLFCNSSVNPNELGIKLTDTNILIGIGSNCLNYNNNYGYVRGCFGTKKNNNTHEQCSIDFAARQINNDPWYRSEIRLDDDSGNPENILDASFIKIYGCGYNKIMSNNNLYPNEKSGYLIYDGKYNENYHGMGTFKLLSNAYVYDGSSSSAKTDCIEKHSSIIFRNSYKGTNTSDWWTSDYHFAYGRDLFSTGTGVIYNYWDYFSVCVDKISLRTKDGNFIMGNAGVTGLIFPGYTHGTAVDNGNGYYVGSYTSEHEDADRIRSIFTGMSFNNDFVSIGRTITDTQQIRTRSSNEETVTRRSSCVLNFTENGLQIGSYDEDDNFNGISIENATKSITIGNSDDPIIEINDGEARINNANYSNTIEYTNYGRLYSMNMFSPNNKVDMSNPSLYNLFDENVCLCDNIHNDDYDEHIYDIPITNIIPQTVNIPLKFIPSMNPIDASDDPYPINYTIFNTNEHEVIDIVPRHNYLIISIDTLASEIASFNEGLDNINIHFSISFWHNGQIINDPTAPQGILVAFNLEINQYLSNKNVLILNPCEKVMALGPNYDSVKVFDSYRVIMRLQNEAKTKTIALHIEQIDIEKSAIKENLLSCYNTVFNANKQWLTEHPSYDVTNP